MISHENRIFSAMGCGTSKGTLQYFRSCRMVRVSEVYSCAADIQPLPPQSRAQTSPSNETNLQQSQGGTWQTIRFIAFALN